jgi:hypothetical protein
MDQDLTVGDSRRSSGAICLTRLFLQPVAASFKEYAASRNFDVLSLDKQELRRQEKVRRFERVEKKKSCAHALAVVRADQL